MQSKSNAWIIRTIWANILAVGVLIEIIFFLISYSGYENVISRLTGGFLKYVTYVLVMVFSIWWGIRYIRKQTRIDSKNYLDISLGVFWVAIIIQLIIFLFLYAAGREYMTALGVADYISIVVYIAILFCVTYFMLKNSR